MLHVLGMGYFHPETEIDNKFIEDLGVGTTAEWIVDKIGIQKRRSVLPLDYIRETRNSDPSEAYKYWRDTQTNMAVQAAGMAFKRAGIEASQIGMVICNCCTPDTLIPTEGQKIAALLGIKAPVREVFTACPAFALHLDFVDRFELSELPDYILCLSTAVLTANVNYNDRTDGAIWGDGAAAWVISPRHKGRLKVLETFYTSDPTRCDAVVVDRYGHFHQDGRAVRDFSVRQTVRLIKDIESRHPIDWERDIFIGHQANATMLEQITANREIPSSNHWYNVTNIGNQAGAGAPACLAMHWDEITPGQKIVVAVVGAGLSWGSVLLEAV